MRALLLPFLFGTALSLSVLPSTSVGAADTAYDFDIKRAPLAKALMQFARQADVSLVLPHLSYRDGLARPISGQLSMEAALQEMLRGSDFAFEPLPSGAIRVYRKPPQPKASAKETAEQIGFRPEPVRIEEILVSSTRREDLLQKVPYSISVFSGTSIEDSGVTSTDGLMGKVSSVASTNRGRGRNKLVMRGLSDGSFSGSTQSLVATYLDYSRLTYNAPEPGLALIDVEQVEFLRGPQGTLYGTGALGGLYRIVTRKPDYDETELAVGGGLSTTSHGGSSWRTHGVVNIPFGHAAGALRVVGYHEDDAGYIDDIGLGIKNINSNRTSGGRAMLSVSPWESVKVSLGTILQDHHSDDSSYFDGDLEDYERANSLQEPHKDRFLQFVGRIDADLGFADLVSSTAWMKRDINSMLDATLAVPMLADVENPAPSPYTEDRTIESLTHETHLASKTGGRFEWLIGLFLSKRESEQYSAITVPGLAALNPGGTGDVLYDETLEEEMTEAAGFGELTWFASEKLALTVGGRWFGYDIKTESLLRDIGSDQISAGAGDQHLNDFTPKFVISYYASDDTLLYLQGSEGFRVGGINLKGPTAQVDEESDSGSEGDETSSQEAVEHDLTNFQPDKMFSMELGAKLTRMDGKLQLRGATFLTWWRQMQTDQFADTGLPVIGNVGDARNFGAEVEVVYHPTTAWTIRANASWNHAELTKVTADFGTSLGAEVSHPLPGAPSFDGGIGLTYEWPVLGDWTATFGGDYRYSGAAHLLFNAENSRQADAYHMLDMRLDMRRGSWLVRLYADNIMNSDANSFAFGNPFSLASVEQVTPLKPRTIGLEVSWRY